MLPAIAPLASVGSRQLRAEGLAVVMVPPLPTGPAVAGPRPVGRVPDGRDVGADLETSTLITLGESVIAVAADRGSPNGPQEVVGRAVDELGGLDIVVNIVGIFPYRGSFWSQPQTKIAQPF